MAIGDDLTSPLSAPLSLQDAKLAQRTRFINAFRMRVEHQHSSRSRRGDLYKMLLEKTHS